MARDLLKQYTESRGTFCGKFERYGMKLNWHNFPEKTILLLDVYDAKTSQLLTDHLWFSSTKQFLEVDLQPEEIVVFNARCRSYIKGYFDRKDWIDYRTTDYKLSYPTKIFKFPPNTSIQDIQNWLGISAQSKKKGAHWSNTPRLKAEA